MKKKDEFDPSKKDLKRAEIEIKAYKKRLEQKAMNELRDKNIDPELRNKSIMDAGTFVLKLIGVGFLAIALYVFFSWLAWLILG